MPRKEREGRTPDHVRHRSDNSGSGRSDHNADGLSSNGQPVPATTYATEIADHVKWFALQDDGWLRVVPEPDSLEVHIKWKFTGGKWAGYYCYVRVFISQLDAGLHFLRVKVTNVRAGTATPTPDRYYSPTST